jgi:hypothetical protein
MASWLKCTAKRDGAAVYVNLENAVECVLEPARQGHHHSLRRRREGDAVTVQEKPEQIIKDR